MILIMEDAVLSLDDGRDLLPYVVFSTSRSSGPGGQNVNKVNTRVELRFNIVICPILNDEEKERIQIKLANKITLEGDLIIVRQTERSQLKNKEKAISAFYSLINKALKPEKKRKPTQMPFAVKVKRKDEKMKLSEKKAGRRGDISIE